MTELRPSDIEKLDPLGVLFKDQADSPEFFETATQMYASCFGIDWRALKGIAFAESTLVPQKCSGNYQGYFQISQHFCEDGIRNFKQLNCNNRCEPETNIAAAAQETFDSIRRISRACPSAPVEASLYLVYVGHNNGPGVLNYLLTQRACNYSQMVDEIVNYYNSTEAGKKSEVGADWGKRKLAHGSKVVSMANRSKLRSLWATPQTVGEFGSPNHWSSCPLLRM